MHCCCCCCNIVSILFSLHWQSCHGAAEVGDGNIWAIQECSPGLWGMLLQPPVYLPPFSWGNDQRGWCQVWGACSSYKKRENTKKSNPIWMNKQSWYLASLYLWWACKSLNTPQSLLRCPCQVTGVLTLSITSFSNSLCDRERIDGSFWPSLRYLERRLH